MFYIADLKNKIPYFVSDLNDAGYSDDRITNMEFEFALDVWLQWRGIIGYTTIICQVFETLRAATIE